MNEFKELYLEKMTKKKEELKTKLENKCYVCDSLQGTWKSEKRLVGLSFHRINGKSHPLLSTLEGLTFIESHINEFVLLCSYCHAEVHRFKKKQFSASEVIKLLKLASFV